VEGQEQLFIGAVEACILSAQFHLGEGWTLRLQIRRQFEDWADCRTEVYDHLTTDELVDVLDVSLGTVKATLGYLEEPWPG
jgi:hypothetical protein